MDAPRSDALVVEEEHDGLRLDQFLTSVLPGQSRSQIQRLIKDGRVTAASGAAVRASTPVRAGRTLHRRLSRAARRPSRSPRRCRFASSTRIPTSSCSTSRPAWWCTRRPATQGGTLVNALLHHVEGSERHRRRGAAGHRPPARSRDVGADGRRQARSRAPGAGAAVPRSRGREGIHGARLGRGPGGRRIDAPIGRDPNDRQKMSTRARRARSAVTRVTFARHFKGVTFLKVAIATGRTHQIRVHLSAIGHPIVGDQTYGGVHRRVGDNLRAVMRLERPFLHACRLCVHAPVRRPPRRVRLAAAARPRGGASRTSRREKRARWLTPERLSTERSLRRQGVRRRSRRVRMPNGREVTVDVVRHPPSAVIVAGARAGPRDPDPAVPLRDQSVAVGVPGRQRGRGRNAGTGGDGASATRRSARCRTPSSASARCFRRPATATRRCSSSASPA